MPAWRSAPLSASRPLRIAAAVFVCFLFSGVGCQPSPVAQRRVQMRTERVRRTVSAWTRSEQSRPQRLADDLDRLPAWLQRQGAQLQRNGLEATRLGERDVQRFRDRRPLYQDETARILRGKPEQIERETVTMFF